MYFLGYMGNNLYPSYMRLFSSREILIEYMANYHVEVEKMSWKCYKLQVNEDTGAVNINKRTLVKWVQEYRASIA